MEVKHISGCLNVTCSAVKIGSSLMQETMMECISSCSLSSSSSDRSRDWLSNFCPSAEGGQERDIQRERELGWDNTGGQADWGQRCYVFTSVSQLWKTESIAWLIHYTVYLSLCEIEMCVWVFRGTSIFLRLSEGRCSERVCEVFQSTGITLP